MKLKDTYPKDTLGYDYLFCRVLFGEDSDASKFLRMKAEESPRGWDEPVIAPEEQRVALYSGMHLAWMERTEHMTPLAPGITLLHGKKKDE